MSQISWTTGLIVLMLTFIGCERSSPTTSTPPRTTGRVEPAASRGAQEDKSREELKPGLAPASGAGEVAAGEQGESLQTAKPGVDVIAARSLIPADEEWSEVVQTNFREKLNSLGHEPREDAQVLAEPRFYLDRWRAGDRDLVRPHWRLYLWDVASGSLIGLITTQDFAFCDPIAIEKGTVSPEAFSQQLAASLRRLDHLQIRYPEGETRASVSFVDGPLGTAQAVDPWRGWFAPPIAAPLQQCVFVDFGDDRGEEIAAHNYFLEPTLYEYLQQLGWGVAKDEATAHAMLRVKCRAAASEGFYIGSSAQPYVMTCHLELRPTSAAASRIWSHTQSTHSPESYSGSLLMATSKRWREDFLAGEAAAGLRKALDAAIVKGL